VLVQRENVEKDCKILQALLDNEMDDTTFTWYPHRETVWFTDVISNKQRRQREELVFSEEGSEVIFEEEYSQTFHHFGHSAWYYLTHRVFQK
jgi:hypothetical protein